MKSFFSSFLTPQKSKETCLINEPSTGLPALDPTTFDPSRCIVQPLPKEILHWRSNTKNPQFAIVIENVLTLQECQEWIVATEHYGYEAALVNIGGGNQLLATDVRNSSRCIIDSEERAQELWNRIESFVPKDLFTIGTKGEAKRTPQPTGLNERLRFLRYNPGEYFRPHMDGSFTYPIDHPTKANQTSYVTFQLYLNDGFEGGATRFFADWSEKKYYDVIPKAGSVLLFEHQMYHEGSILEKGRKYAMRTDIMYTEQ